MHGAKVAVNDDTKQEKNTKVAVNAITQKWQ